MGLVLLVRVGLSVVSYRRLQPWLASRAAPRPGRMGDPRRARWGVAVASRLVPGATCLTQALAVQFLLARGGHPSEIRVGVAKDPDGRFRAHAWLVAGGQIVIGGTPQDLQQYTHLTDLPLTS